MIPEKQIEEIRELLEKSQNPLFFFDSDVDGLSSFLLLRRQIDRGRGVAIKNPALNKAYERKLHELKPDYVFILDIPVVEKNFLDECRQLGMPVVRIDHHPVEEASLNDANMHYYNPLLWEEKSSEPVSYWCHKITGKDEWIAMMGCISDWYIPDFVEEFAKKYGDIFSFTEYPEETLFGTEFGRLIRILDFALKDTTTNVIEMLRILWNAKDPYEILHESKKYEKITSRYRHIKKKYETLLEKAVKKASKEKGSKIFYFEYSSDLGLSAGLANELLYRLKDKDIIAIVRIRDLVCKISLRGKGAHDMRKLVEKLLEGTDGKGGGHEHACGITLKADDLAKFKKNLFQTIKTT